MLFYILVGLLPVLPLAPVLIQGGSKVMVQKNICCFVILNSYANFNSGTHKYVYYLAK